MMMDPVPGTDGPFILVWFNFSRPTGVAMLSGWDCHSDLGSVKRKQDNVKKLVNEKLLQIAL